MIGAMSSLAPKRAPTFAKLAVRALAAGTIACLCTGCMVSILYVDDGREFLWNGIDISSFEISDCEVRDQNGTVLPCSL